MGEIYSRPGNSLLVEVAWALEKRRVCYGVRACLERQPQPLFCLSAPPQSWSS